MSDKRTVLTIATGKKLYTDMAVNLARSFFWWHPDTDIEFHIVTDKPELFPEDVTLIAKIIIVQPGELGEGFSPKLHLDKLCGEGQTLFIDSDCLIFGKLDFIFERFKGHKVSVVGGYISDGDWFGDIGHICSQFKVPHLPKFNGGIYYLEKGVEATAVYEKARSLEKTYDEIGFVRLRNRPNDEVLMALAMQLHNQKPIPDDGTIMSDPQACPGGYYIDVIKGDRRLINPPPPHPKHQAWYPFEKVSPVVFHFLGYYTHHYPYMREAYRLEKATFKKLNWGTELFGLMSIEYTSRIIEFTKNTFRPAYHKLFGHRKVKVSNRV
ncbi:MAG: hypothetical protein JST50_01885 [Bacteroidetes bacterium]|nr:hypothetical protein [Bacteroidota bacterium]